MTDNKDLRQRAEEIAHEKAVLSAQDLAALSPAETGRILHELQIHQLELEMQNEELRRAQLELDSARARYFDLYEMAPVGYCTISEPGLILEANLTAATLLGRSRGALVNQLFSKFVLLEDLDSYYLHRKRLFAADSAGSPQACELHMVRKGGIPFWVHLESTLAQASDGAAVCRVIMSDISEQKAILQALINTLNDVKTLRGILPICANCKKIRDDQGYWSQVEEYIRDHSEAEFSHGICPECVKILYPTYQQKKALPHKKNEAL